ncbi:hypothetical protein ACF9IK_08490 [Kitasatospora hibisci]|uniref:hypothetical protein n=1 Tax=Kitasatospora hibisci TaxID=3369522 RepID=UPI0037542851
MVENYTDLPAPESVRIIDFDEARAVPGIVPGTFILVVNGVMPYQNMTVRLSPRVYVERPVHWGIEVVGSLPGIGIPATAPYTVSLPLDGVLGTRGIEVIGANRTEQIAVP